MNTHLHKTLYQVCRLKSGVEARCLINQYHYAKSAPQTFTDLFGLLNLEGTLLGCAWFVPTFPGPAKSVAGDRWREVINLSRLVIHPDVPTNGASFLLGRSLRYLIGKHLMAITYADEGEGHSGIIYRATNWTYLGSIKTKAHWIDPLSGCRVCTKSTVNRSVRQMEELGYKKLPPSIKHKYLYNLTTRRG